MESSPYSCGYQRFLPGLTIVDDVVVLFSVFLVCRMPCYYTCCSVLSYLHVSCAALNHRQGLIRFGLKAFSPQRGERHWVVAEVNTADLALSSSSPSVPPLASRMRISGSDSETGGIQLRSNLSRAWVRLRWEG